MLTKGSAFQLSVAGIGSSGVATPPSLLVCCILEHPSAEDQDFNTRQCALTVRTIIDFSLFLPEASSGPNFTPNHAEKLQEALKSPFELDELRS